MSNFGVPTDVQLAQINKLAKRTLSADELFVFSSKSAGDMMIPQRYTRISPELLQIMVDDAHKGVSFMYNHNWSSYQGLQGVPYGKIFGGRIEASNDEGETMAMYLDKYIARDDNVVDGMSANALIKKIETGILSDTSVSFSTDIMKCSICAENYYSNKCRHYRGGTYEMGDGTQKQCTLTAMPPSIILANNNNALYEESIVWDGAYPGAMITQSKHGDIVETSTGKFSILDDKEELPENTLLFGKYHNGDIVTMVKKSDHKKIFKGASIEDDTLEIVGGDGKTVILKGGEKNMNENLKKMLEAFGIKFDEETFKEDALLAQLAEKWDATVEVIKASVEPLKPVGEFEQFMEKETVSEKLGAELSADEVLKLAKEGQEYHAQTIEDAIAMGVRAQGNDFTAETWKTTFATMSTKAIKDIMKTFELQANDDIPTGRLSTPNTKNKLGQSLPDEAYRV